MNWLYIGKSLLQLGRVEEAGDWLRKAANYQSQLGDDIEVSWRAHSRPIEPYNFVERERLGILYIGIHKRPHAITKCEYVIMASSITILSSILFLELGYFQRVSHYCLKLMITNNACT